MRTSFILTITLLLNVTIGFSQTQEKEASLLLEKFISNNVTVGAVAGYSVDGEIKWQSAVGYSDKKNRTPFNVNTITRVASVVKLFTAVAVMQLIEQGLIDLNDPIQKYVPDFPKSKFGTITIKQLLNHTSGIGGYKSGKEAETKKEYPTLADAMNVFKDRKLLFRPGSQYSYSTYGYVLLGVLIERVSETTYKEYIQTNILDKAGMKHTAIEKFGVQVPNKSLLYHRNRKGKIKKAANNNLSNRIPGGGFYTTLGDMFKFGDAIINNQLINKNTLSSMFENNGLKKGGNAHGIGWFMYAQNPNNSAVIGHSGEQTGCSAQLMIVPKSKTVVMVMVNTSGSWKEAITLAANLIGISEKSRK
ncbi:serine hydrolase domain-containing protein [Flavobacteriaceae bacterium S356]|uniref:Serine hydrolase domain-containing protein n=1 Tax=Asprobacillus argus TaxID=3076534 RepID=A0ABU3LH04_9FLAO|nr:serine hydrolase domain-containing protein [Flavobacteriaceae bacterium S356]